MEDNFIAHLPSIVFHTHAMAMQERYKESYAYRKKDVRMWKSLAYN